MEETNSFPQMNKKFEILDRWINCMDGNGTAVGMLYDETGWFIEISSKNLFFKNKK